MIETFLTAFDPSDLPGASIDPLGFERGYLFLADKILPGMTNVASHPRYFAILCAGIHLSAGTDDQTERDAVRGRHGSILRLERFWALANVLARPEGSGGVRGVTYARDYAQALERGGARRTKADYRLLSRQSQYGAIGMYASVADGMHFFNREDLVLTPALGKVVAEAFLEETGLPASLRRAVVEDSEVSLLTLADWGARAHVKAEVQPREAECFHEALHFNDVRSRMVEVLRAHPARAEEEAELERLARVSRTLNREEQHNDLREAIECILAYENCYQHALLAFERMLWLCRHHAAASVTLGELDGDSVLRDVKTALPGRVGRLTEALDGGSSPGFREGLDRLYDVRRFLESAAGKVDEHPSFIDAFIHRHSDVQHGKFDRGRRKMPWLERHDCRIQLTMTRAGGRNREITQPGQVAPHPYRLGAADAFIAASLKAVHS
jgi:hypothetical protein